MPKPADPSIEEAEKASAGNATSSSSSWVENTLLEDEELEPGKAASGEKSTPVTPKPPKEKSTIKTLITNIPVKRKVEEDKEPKKGKEDDEVEVIDEEKVGVLSYPDSRPN